MPTLRIEDGMIVGRQRGRLWRSRWRHLRSLARCMLGHDFSEWTIDDMDGPGEDLGDGEFMPWFSRESRPGEYGLRTCQRRCGTMEVRWPIDQAPDLWREKLGV